jgi:hypothetical protein
MEQRAVCGNDCTRRLRVLTWHVHGSYLYYLSQAQHDFYLVTLPGHPPGHAGRTGRLPWGANVHEVPAHEVRRLEFDCVLYQSREDFDIDRFMYLSEEQRALPALYLEHDPPSEHPTDERHPAAEDGMHIVHVTHHNALMWNNGGAPTHVIEHGVLLPPELHWDGGRPEGIAVMNRERRPGRRPGADLYAHFADRVPLTLAGKGSEKYGGIGEVPNTDLPALMANYRLYLHPVHYTSLGLSLIEAMMLGMPVVVLATPELPSVIRDGVDGCVDTRIGRLLEAMQDLLADAALARRWGEAARATARKHFGIERFSADWDRLLRQACAAWQPLAIAA